MAGTNVADVSCEEQIDLESRTLKAMIALYCGARHGTSEGFCGECDRVWQYAQQRAQRCPFLPDKPACTNCTVHCYKPEMRERIREIMRRTGPRMPWHHPFLTLRHFVRECAGSTSAR